ncbi:hypothetical protein [Desulfosediminicola ganghwensis]|uniref:hypothetical protein n=1 Tax=Desulfosediminicola ganghwensis TaxID=2569540 RepID=UPI0010AD48A9|nr:hypothetical protein [Desulfosediminicola ganghwensis]
MLSLLNNCCLVKTDIYMCVKVFFVSAGGAGGAKPIQVFCPLPSSEEGKGQMTIRALVPV